MPFNISPAEIMIILVIALLIFGPKRLPELGRSMGKGIREFRHSLGGHSEDKDDAEKEPRELSSAEDRETEAAEPLEGEVVHDRKS